MNADQSADDDRYVKLQIWTRHDPEYGDETIYKLPDGTEYRGIIYGRLEDSDG